MPFKKGHKVTPETIRKRQVTRASRVYTMSAQGRENIRKANLGKIISDETRQKMKKAAKNKPPITEETRQKLSKTSSGKRHTEDTKQKMRGPKIQFCTRGHDTFVVGRTRGRCRSCHSFTINKANLKHQCSRVGITVEFYNSLPKTCSFPGCDVTKPGGRGGWHRDHDHIEGFNQLPFEKKGKYFRGLLCQYHNTVIVGPNTVESALNLVVYLTQGKSELIKAAINFLDQVREISKSQ